MRRKESVRKSWKARVKRHNDSLLQLLQPNPLPEWPPSDDESSGYSSNGFFDDDEGPPNSSASHPTGSLNVNDANSTVSGGHNSAANLHSVSSEAMLIVLKLLPLEDIGSFSASCKSNLKEASSDVLWSTLYDRYGFVRLSDESLRDNYLLWRSICCVECKRPTKYIFELLSIRLCEFCERQRKKYLLVSRSDAKEFFLLKNAHLKHLPHIDRESPLNTKSRSIRFYLRRDVIDVAEELFGGPEGLRNEQRRVKDMKRAVEARCALSKNANRRHKRHWAKEKNHHSSSEQGHQRQELEFGKYGISGLSIVWDEDEEGILERAARYKEWESAMDTMRDEKPDCTV